MWLKNFFNELKAWRIVRKVYRQNRSEFESVGLKKDYFGKLYKVINRDPAIDLGTGEDEVYLRKELAELWAVLVKHNIVDILAYELIPLEEERQINEKEIEYEHGYLVLFTPAWNLDRQYVTTTSFTLFILSILLILSGLTYGVVKYLIPYFQTL